MAQRINLSNAIGKTIAGVVIGNWCETCIIMFNDDTFSTVDATGGGDSCYHEISLDEEFQPLAFGDSKLIELGLYSVDDLKAMKDERAARQAVIREEDERTQLQRLLQKYGIPQG